MTGALKHTGQADQLGRLQREEPGRPTPQRTGQTAWEGDRLCTLAWNWVPYVPCVLSQATAGDRARHEAARLQWHWRRHSSEGGRSRWLPLGVEPRGRGRERAGHLTIYTAVVSEF